MPETTALLFGDVTPDLNTTELVSPNRRNRLKVTAGILAVLTVLGAAGAAGTVIYRQRADLADTRATLATTTTELTTTKTELTRVTGELATATDRLTTAQGRLEDCKTIADGFLKVIGASVSNPTLYDLESFSSWFDEQGGADPIVVKVLTCQGTASDIALGA
jgi:hypothetical protein